MINPIKWFDNLKFRKKLIFVFGFTLIITLMITLSTLITLSLRILKKNNIDNLRIITDQVSENFSQRLTEVEKILFNIINMFQIPDYMDSLDKEKSSYAYRELDYMTNQLVSSTSPFDFVMLETKEGYTADTSDKLTDKSDFGQKNAQKILSEYKMDLQKYAYIWAIDEKGNIFVLHNVRQITSLKHMGYVIARVRKANMRMLKEGGNQGIGLLFFNASKSCLFSEGNDERLQAEIISSLKAGQDIVGNQEWQKQSYYAVKKQLDSGWTVTGIMPMSSIVGMRTTIISVEILAAFLALGLGSSIVKCLTRKVSRQLEALTVSMNQISEQNIRITVPVYCHDDIGELTECFNAMNEKITELLEKIVTEERLKNKAELQALDYRYHFLQAQINPHFIYNALETVNAIAKIHKVPEISNVIQLVGRYFRSITAYSDQQFIELKAAFENLKIYIKIYHYIHGSELLAEVDYQEELADVQIPNMILQPIVENCFVHGLRTADELSIIRVCAKRDHEQIRIIIADNGMGIVEKGQQISSHTGIGLTNIIERLSLLYGDNGKLLLKSCECGTTVTILIPYEESNDFV